ncbi:MAG TPA: hypothetical protein VKB71_03635 [Rhizomicrobium sp.]|nr:hypothetical protein [Rhizomicrobium sp.]
MNRSRFASVTSGLLVRKGEAKPWQMPGSEIAALRSAPPTHHFAATADDESFHEEERRQAHLAEEERTAAQDYLNWKRAQDAALAAERRASSPADIDVAQADPAIAMHFHHDHAHEEYSKRCTLRLSSAEYERLGIIGVKREMTRQQILRHAIDTYLDQAKNEYQASCGCLAGECRGDC